jgi:AsmA protein
MKKAVKFLLYGVAGLVLLVALALGATLAIVDGQFVKSRLERAMKAKNRTLLIEGTPAVRLFPVAALSLGKTTLSEPGSDRQFVALESADVAVRVMPLLSGEVAVETLKLSGLKATLVRRKDGSMNFSDLVEPQDKDKKPEAPPNLRLAEVSVEKVQISYRDEASGQELNVAELNLKTGRLDGQTPGEVSLQARITGKRPDADLRAQASGALRFNLAREEFAFDKFNAQVKGRYDQDSVAAEFGAPKVEVSRAKAAGSEVKVAVQVKGSQRNVDARLLIAAVEGNATALTIPKVSLDLNLSLGGVVAKANLLASVKANLAKQDLDADISGKVDEGTVKLKLAATNFVPLKASFDAQVDRVNADRYIPPEKKDAKGDEPINLAFLRGKTVNGKLAIGSLTALRIKAENVKAEVKLADGKLEISPHSLGLYGGTMAGAISADANGNRVHVKEDIKGVAVGQLLRDYARKDMLDGRGDISFDVNGAGASTLALKRALAGSARIQMKEGAIKGVDLNNPMRSVTAALPMKTTQHDPSKKTDFSDLSATFAIKNGVARNDDLKMQAALIRVGGAGNLDIGNNGIDYLAKATLATGGVTIPVKLSGALDNPSWNVDYTGLVGGAGGALGKAAGGLTDTAKKGAGGVTDAVRGLFRR